jgi:hypothetical protein
VLHSVTNRVICEVLAHGKASRNGFSYGAWVFEEDSYMGG